MDEPRKASYLADLAILSGLVYKSETIMTIISEETMYESSVVQYFTEKALEQGGRDRAIEDLLDVPPNRVGQIIAGKRSVTGDTALRFGHWFGVEPQFWLNLQAQFDLVA